MELDGPIVRVAADDCHLPYNGPEEEAIIPNPTKVIEELYARCLSRTPTEKEMAKLKSYFGDKKSDEQVVTDIFWALLNSKEFIFNH